VPPPNRYAIVILPRPIINRMDSQQESDVCGNDRILPTMEPLVLKRRRGLVLPASFQCPGSYCLFCAPPFAALRSVAIRDAPRFADDGFLDVDSVTSSEGTSGGVPDI